MGQQTVQAGLSADFHKIWQKKYRGTKVCRGFFCIIEGYFSCDCRERNRVDKLFDIVTLLV